MAEMHGGHATAHSEGIEKGSTFTVSLPLAAAPSPEKKPKPVPPGPPLSVAHRVLVVDDVADTANGLARLLRKQGHTVEVATDGAEACKQAHRFAPEVVLLDIGMPGMDGYEVARHLRSDDTCANMLLVALTGYGQDEDRRRALEAGFDEHLVKPIDFERLKELIVTAPHMGNY
jgi:CheY-like chemotaxis protein